MNYDMPMTEGRVLPQITLREIDFPQVNEWEVGDKKYVVMKVEMTAKRSGKNIGLGNGNDSTKIEGDFQMLSIKSLGVEPVDAKSLETKEFNDVIAKIKSGQM